MSEISILWPVSVAEETGLNLTLSKTGFVASRPIGASSRDSGTYPTCDQLQGMWLKDLGQFPIQSAQILTACG